MLNDQGKNFCRLARADGARLDRADLDRTGRIVVGQGLAVFGMEPGGEAGELGEDAGTLHRFVFAVVVIPGQAPLPVVAALGRRIGQLGAGDGVVLLAVEEMDETPAPAGLVPGVIAVAVTDGLLLHYTAGRQPHFRLLAFGRSEPAEGRFLVPILVVTVRPGAIEVAEGFDLHGIDQDLQTAILCLAGQLLLGGIAFTQGHGDELADLLFTDVEAIEKAILAGYHVVLVAGEQFAAPGFAGDDVDLAGADLDGKGVGLGKVEGERL